jgi:hypothetical protein
MSLTLKNVYRLKPGLYLDKGPSRHCVKGLYLHVISRTAASYFLRFKLDGVEYWMGLGSLWEFDLTEARQRARAARQLLADGINPLQQKREQRAERLAARARTKLFQQVAEEWLAAKDASWSRKHYRDLAAGFKHHVYPTLGALPIASIDEPLILEVLRLLWDSKTALAKRQRSNIESVLDFATAAGYRSGDNPARWEGHLEHLLAPPEKIAKTKHHDAYLTPSCPPSWSSCGRGLASRRGRWSSVFSVPTARAKFGARVGTRLT